MDDISEIEARMAQLQFEMKQLEKLKAERAIRMSGVQVTIKSKTSPASHKAVEAIVTPVEEVKIDEPEYRVRNGFYPYNEDQLGPVEPPVVTFKITDLDASNYFHVRMEPFDYGALEFMRKIAGRMPHADTTISLYPLRVMETFMHEAHDNPYRAIAFANEEIAKRALAYFNTPDITLVWNEKDQLVRVKTSAQQGRLAIYNIPSFKSRFYSHNDFELSKYDLVELTEELSKLYPKAWLHVDASLKEMLDEMVEREKLTKDLITAEDAPEIEDNIFTDTEFKFRPYQRVAVKFAEVLGLRALVSYDMGLGKTAIALYLSEKHNLRTLFITKAKLKENVKRELKRLTGKDCVVLAGTNPGNLEMRKLIVEKDKHQYYMINYDIVGRPIRDASEAGQKQKDEVQKQIMPWVELINMSQFDLIIYDEAHYMKNLDSQRSTGGRALKAKHAIPLTATPIVNGVSDLFAVLSIVDPKRFSVFEAFKEEYATADGRGIRNPARLKRLLNQYMIRRRKEDVEKDLPPIIRHDYFHELSSAAAKKYADLEEGLYQKLRSYDSKDIKAVNNILEQMLRMKQLTADDKVETSVDLAREAYEETGKKVIIFSQFKESQIEIAKQLGWDNCRVINGDTSEKNLYLYKEEFQNSDKYPYLSLSTHVGQEGFNFTAAHTVIFNDLMWTPKDHRQAEARAYGRLNDLHGANAYYVQATDTIDEQITEILMRKLRIIETAVDGAQHAAVESASVLSDLIKYLKEKR